jgi:hypothetical protein
MTYRSLSILVLAFLLGGISLEAKLRPIKFDEFRERIDCAVVGTVLETADRRMAEESLDSDQMPRLAFVATVRINEVLFGCDCLHDGDEIRFFYSGEVHSSQPQIGDRAVLFPALKDDGYEESVYGRSYWPIIKTGNTEMVQWTWRNEFLIEVLPGNVTGVELNDIRRFFKNLTR